MVGVLNDARRRTNSKGIWHVKPPLDRRTCNSKRTQQNASSFSANRLCLSSRSYTDLGRPMTNITYRPMFLSRVPNVGPLPVRLNTTYPVRASSRAAQRRGIDCLRRWPIVRLLRIGTSVKSRHSLPHFFFIAYCPRGIFHSTKSSTSTPHTALLPHHTRMHALLILAVASLPPHSPFPSIRLPASTRGAPQTDGFALSRYRCGLVPLGALRIVL